MNFLCITCMAVVIALCLLSAVYHVGHPKWGWSDLYFFRAMIEGANWSPSFAVFGDMGNVNAQSVPRLQEETQRGHFDAILHVGKHVHMVQ